MRVQQVPNSPYFINYDDEGFCCISKSRESQEPIPESEMQAFLGAVANGLLYIEKERKSRYQRIDEAEKAAVAKQKKQQMRAKLKKETSDNLAKEEILQDDRFFFIAGYTSGGAPYGVTWEEMGLKPWEDLEENN